MTKIPIKLQDLRRKIYIKAKAEPEWRFWGIYVHVCKMETLEEAYKLTKWSTRNRWSDIRINRSNGRKKVSSTNKA